MYRKDARYNQPSLSKHIIGILITNLLYNFGSQIFLSTEDIHNGRSGDSTGGLLVANHAEGESSIALARVPILRRKTEEETAADWNLINNHRDVTHAPAQVKLS